MKHISVDVWNTLIRSNPDYAKKRAEYIASELSLPINIIESAYQRVKKEADKLAEHKGECLSNMEIYKKFLLLVKRQDYDWLKLRDGLEMLFEEYPPIILSETIETLHILQDKHVSLSIASNTNFIRGATLYYTILNKLGIEWKFEVFSDELGKPKPHPDFWRSVIRMAHIYSGAMPYEILHVGDSKICDGSCLSACINFKHVKTPWNFSNNLSNIVRCVS